MAFIATFKDGHKRIIAHPKIDTYAKALKYAIDLEAWFEDSLPQRVLLCVELKK
jgi:hypothetical protein